MNKPNRKDIEKLALLLENTKRPVLITHMGPDGDAIGSTLGMMRFIALYDKKATLILPTAIPETLSFMRKADDGPLITASIDSPAACAAIESADLIICLDFNSIKRAEGLEKPFHAASCTKVLIDHHLEPDSESFDLVFSEINISSASELVFWLLMALPQIDGDCKKLPIGTLEALMTGMTTDTNNFANSVFPTTFQMASECLAAGVDRDSIISNIYNEYREERYRLLGYILSEKLHITDKGAAYVVLSADELDRFNIKEGETEGFVNIPLSIGRVRVSLFLKEQEGRFRVSIRAKKGTSANLLARQSFNGGGHELASGGRLEIGEEFPDAKTAEAYIRKATDEFLKDE